jgi:WD40 repeat protein
MPTAAAFSPDCTALACALDCEIKIWDLATESWNRTINIKSSRVEEIIFSPDSVTLAAVFADNSVEVLDATDGSCKQSFPHDSCPLFVDFSPDGKRLTTTTVPAGILRLWDISAGTCKEISGPEGGGASFARAIFSPTGKEMALLSGDFSITGESKLDVVDVAFTSNSRTLGFGTSTSLLIFTGDGKTIVTSNALGLIQFWDTTSTMKHSSTDHDRRVSYVTLSSEGKPATASLDKTVKLWDIQSKSHERTLRGHNHQVKALAFSPDGKTLASGGFDGEIRIWDTATGTCKHTLGIFENNEKVNYFSAVMALQFSTTGSLLIGGKGNGMVKIWDTITWECKHKFEASRGLCSISTSQDERILFAGSFHGEDAVWDMITGSRKQIRDAERQTTHVAVSPDGNLLAAGRRDHVQIWNATDGDFQPVAKIQNDAIRRISFSEDNSYLKLDNGFYNVISGAPAATPDTSLSQTSIYLDEAWWVARGGRKLLHLAPDYHKSFLNTITWNNTFIIADDAGQVIFFEFSES